jgi:hypothetical protein
MNLLNNFLHNDYVWIPLYIGTVGFLGWSWWSESTRVFNSITNTQLNAAKKLQIYNRDSITSISDTSTVRPHNFSDTNRMAAFEDRIQTSIQHDLERINSSFNQNINSIKVSEKTLNVTELYDSGRLDLLSDTAWSSSNGLSHMDSLLLNRGDVLTSYPQVVDLISS